MMITALTCALSLLNPWPAAIAIAGAGNHRQPIPGETQVWRWTVSDTGSGPLTNVRLTVHAPVDWTVLESGACRAARAGFDCPLGGLAAGASRTVTLRLVVPAHPRFGPVRISARVRADTNVGQVIGTSAGFQVEVVSHRH